MSKNSSRMAVAKRGHHGGLVVALICIIMAGVACGPEPVSQFATLIPTATSTATPIPPTVTATPLPTLTTTPHPAQIFADPILEQIANRPPDYQDDFSDSTSGWETGRRDDTIMHGSMQYLGGEYVFILDPVRQEQIDSQVMGNKYRSGASAKGLCF
jgi:hypothetical protein